MAKEIRVEGREGNKINGRIYTPGVAVQPFSIGVGQLARDGVMTVDRE